MVKCLPSQALGPGFSSLQLKKKKKLLKCQLSGHGGSPVVSEFEKLRQGDSFSSVSQNKNSNNSNKNPNHVVRVTG